MTDEQAKQAATDAVTQARSMYGPGWSRVSQDARVGAAVRCAITTFSLYAPDAPASDVAKVFHLISDQVCPA